MTFWLPIFLLALQAVPAVPQVVDQEKWNTVERMCGKLEWVEEIPLKGKIAEFEEKSTPLKNADVRLYHRQNEPSCCVTALLIGRTVTNKRGEFEFNVEDLFPGNYWVMVELNGKQYSHAIKYAGTKFESGCSDLLYDIKKGELQLRRVIQVD
jgi:hypothetical protein